MSKTVEECMRLAAEWCVAFRNYTDVDGDPVPANAARDALKAALTDHFADLEAKLAKSNHELSELRTLHRQMVANVQDVGERLIEDTCG